MLDIIETISQWLQSQQPLMLATVIQTWGSSPRAVGAKMAINPNGEMAGSVSGGCVEAAVIADALENPQPHLLDFGVSDESAWGVGLACGGELTVWVEPLDTYWWQLAVNRALHDQTTVTITIVQGEQVGKKAVFSETGAVLYSTLSAEHLAAISPLRDQAGYLPEHGVFIDVQHPRPHLVIVGGVHVAITLQHFAAQLGFRVSLIDPRKSFATWERFPQVDHIFHLYPDKVFAQMPPDANTYIAILTHDPKIDDLALVAALPSPAPYIGVLSSRNTHEKRVKRLQTAGVDPALISRIRTPIGLDIGARTPAEIALCIMAEIIAVRNAVE